MPVPLMDVNNWVCKAGVASAWGLLLARPRIYNGGWWSIS